jgi:superfamily II DNA or RNA helicase
MMQLRPHQQHALELLNNNSKGIILVPTGGGKTFIAITDAQRQFKSLWNWDDTRHQFAEPKTIVVVAPRILLAEQLSAEFLEHITDVKVLHVHSGETHHRSTTNKTAIYDWAVNNWKYHKLIFTTYNSLHRIQEANINVDTIYFDECHNSIQRHFFPATEYFSNEAKRCYFFTATPKHSVAVGKPGMNDEDVYGKVLLDVPAPELVKQGVILPPKVIVKKIDMPDDSRTDYEKDCENVLSTLDDIDVAKVLICARNTSQIVGLMNRTHFANQLQMRGYNILYITAKTGGVINGSKVTREQFFDKLNTWGKDDNARFIVMHHSILSEGMNIKGLEAALFLRNMNYIGISQTIGRIIRKGNESKVYGLVVVPCYDRVGISTAKSINAVVDVVFNKGKAAVSTIKR